MTAPATVPLMTAEQLLALPDDGVERWLIRGQLRESTMTYRNRWHSLVEAQVVYLLKQWLEQQTKPRGAVLSGEAGFLLGRDPDTIVGIEVGYISAKLAAHDPGDTTLVAGVPTLVVEILSPSEKTEDIHEKVDEYLKAGVPLVWLVDPHFRTVAVYRPDAEPELFNATQELSAEPHLPGFSIAVARIFER